MNESMNDQPNIPTLYKEVFEGLKTIFNPELLNSLQETFKECFEAGKRQYNSELQKSFEKSLSYYEGLKNVMNKTDFSISDKFFKDLEIEINSLASNESQLASLRNKFAKKVLGVLEGSKITPLKSLSKTFPQVSSIKYKSLSLNGSGGLNLEGYFDKKNLDYYIEEGEEFYIYEHLYWIFWKLGYYQALQDFYNYFTNDERFKNPENLYEIKSFDIEKGSSDFFTSCFYGENFQKERDREDLEMSLSLKKHSQNPERMDKLKNMFSDSDRNESLKKKLNLDSEENQQILKNLFKK